VIESLHLLIDVSLLAFLVLIVFASIKMSDLFAVTMLFGIFSFVSALLFLDLDAVDVAFTEAAVGAGFTTVLMLSALRLTQPYENLKHRHSVLGLFIVTLTGAALFYGVADFPQMGDANAPVHHHIAPEYIQLTQEKVDIPNIVTAVLASFRGYDTFGETVVIFSAGVAVVLLLGMGSVKHKQEPEENLVLWVVVKPMIALILIFGLYVQFHGDFGAGGGFQAGVIFASGFILYSLVFGEMYARRVVPAAILPRLAALGVLIYGGTGLVSLLSNKPFLDYNALSSNPVSGQHMGILLVEAGVGLAVFSTILLIYYSFSGREVSHNE
jgi:multicomponent Na+:H+ antiporter subunit B